MKWINFFVDSKYARNTEGFLYGDNLKEKILKHKGKEAYYCVFDCLKEKLLYEFDTGEKDTNGKAITECYESEDKAPDKYRPMGQTFKGYMGAVRPALNLVQFDFDSENIEESLKDAIEFIKFIEVQYYCIAFSGSKGFHVAIPFKYFDLECDELLPRKLRDFAHFLKEKFPTLDTSVYNANRKFRVLNSKHPKTGKYKTLLYVSSIERGEGYQIDDFHLDYERSIKKLCSKRQKEFYPPYEKQGIKPSTKIKALLESAVHAATAIETEAGGTKHDQTNFEAFNGKKCISQLLERRAEKGQRNETALRLVNDFFKTGKHQGEALDVLGQWAGRNGLPTSEIVTMVNNIYSGRAYYNHGCMDELKAKNCSYKCPIYGKLNPAKRPQVVDAPKSAMKEMQDARLPTEGEAVESILIAFGCERFKGNQFRGGNIIKQELDLFVYQDGKWKHLQTKETDKIKLLISAQYLDLRPFNKIESAYKRFMVSVPSVDEGIDMFSPNPYRANFLNGTLHLDRDKKNDYTLKFREHSREDFLTNIIDLEYNPTSKTKNKMFTEMLDGVFENDEDKQGKLRCLKQMYGASLMPCFPHVFFIQGLSGSGKSTLCLILKELIGQEENMSQVEPYEFNGFNMETMANKLVNMVTDIDVHKPIRDNIFKQIEDRIKVKIKRKGIKDIIASMPAVHVFGANQLPPTFDGHNKTMQRRLSIIRLNKVFKGKAHRDIASRIFESDPQGVLNFAMEGLKDLVESRGFFFNPKSGIKDLTDWETENDIVAEFFEEAGNDGASIKNQFDAPKTFQKNKSEFVKRADLWDTFAQWAKFSGHERHGVKRGQFFKRCRALKLDVDHKRDGYHGLKGYEIKVETLSGQF